ncbi:MAG: YceI family protein [Flavobacteriaceae bacterium]
MYKFSLKTILSICLFTLSIFSVSAQQTYQAQAQNGKIIIEGTSNVHDWDMDVEKFSSQLKATENLASISALELSVEVNGLKSGKGGMDKNAYKALNKDDYKTIVFTSTEVSIEKTSDNTYKAVAKGQLSIAGSSKNVSIPLKLKTSGQNITLEAEHTLDMTNYDVDPPKAMFGTIKTGKEVTINFELTYKS